ncbi:hypothetical protein PHYSODRAFT_330265 [Phytophthora sojae]|uniref:Uncharacterized protein n=1 Tax=Phytophthora sojae (strain P6497) TaxID=1094619 RepID=G4Z7U6_PHYSP|nr:hypothetical protein PHYSODRAFT_330265 [Phytophthora sojae]EGZ22481.1 hypothetical protein PHYSODRAFT_330265 [Phytophthora sojae]|eukprot:XP_009525198.1 hypothetical protein PHYSODRAFT_330265 [Phytophthora sojae]
MATLSKTAQSAALVPGTPSSAPKGLEKRKLGTAAKIRERKRKRAAARKENQGAGAKSSVEAATTTTGGCEAAGAGVKKAAGAKENKLKKAAGTKARKAVGGPLAEALQAAMTEAAAESLETAPAASSVAPCDSRSGAGAPCDSRSGAGAPASTSREHVAAATAHCSHGIIPGDLSDMGSTSRTTDQAAAQILTELASRAVDGGVHHPEVKRAAGRTGKASRRAQTAATDQRVTAQYRVLWLSRLLVNRRYYQRTWEPLQQLLDDGFVNEDEFGKRAIGADARGLCMFNALKRAAELAGRPDIVTQDDIDTFVADELREHGVDLTVGISWKVVLRFLRRLRDAGRDFIFKAIDKDNFTIAGRRGARVLEEVPLYNGLYFVVAYNHSLVGHAFGLASKGRRAGFGASTT